MNKRDNIAGMVYAIPAFRVLIITLIVIFVFFSCENLPQSAIIDYTTINDTAFVIGKDTIVIDGDVTAKEISGAIELQYGNRRYNSLDEYDSLLSILSNPRFVVVPLHRLAETDPDSNQIVVALRHDVDNDPYTAITLARMENSYGLPASYYILHSANYFGYYSGNKLVIYGANMAVWDTIYQLGHEIGCHNDFVTMELLSNLDMKNVISIWHQILSNRGITVYGTAAHGASESRLYGYKNYEFFSEFARNSSFFAEDREIMLGKHSLSDMGYEYEAYFIPIDYYFSESGGRWGRLGNPIEALPTLPTGTKVIILTHPVWWG